MNINHTHIIGLHSIGLVNSFFLQSCQKNSAFWVLAKSVSGPSIINRSWSNVVKPPENIPHFGLSFPWIIRGLMVFHGIKWELNGIEKPTICLLLTFFGSEHNWYRDGTLPVQNGVAMLFKSQLNPAMGGCNFIVYNDGVCNLTWLYHDTSSWNPDMSVVIFLGKQSSFQHVLNRQLSTWSLWKLSISCFPSQFIFSSRTEIMIPPKNMSWPCKAWNSIGRDCYHCWGRQHFPMQTWPAKVPVIEVCPVNSQILLNLQPPMQNYEIIISINIKRTPNTVCLLLYG